MYKQKLTMQDYIGEKVVTIQWTGLLDSHIYIISLRKKLWLYWLLYSSIAPAV